MSTGKRRILFVDRDGTLITEPEDQQVDSLEKLELMEGVIPALLAWGLLALPVQAALIGFAALFALILLVDRRLLPVLDDDYRRLRVPLTGTVALTLLIAALAVVPPPS